MNPLRTFVLSGGGGRGAFHAGVYKYLMQPQKDGLDESHRGAWSPEIVVGTSIGAVNGAAIVQGIAPRRLERLWLALRERDIEGLPPGMLCISRWIANMALKRMIGVSLARTPTDIAVSPRPKEYWPPLPLMPDWLAERLVGKWINLLDTGPLRQTLVGRLNLDPERIARSEKTLLITATNVKTGERAIFSNRPILKRGTGEPRSDVFPGITIERILASCSIPLVYPWTYDRETDAYYWDGAVVANTPLGAALDAVGDQPVEIPMEVVVVLMTPWWERGEPPPRRARELPASFGEAITWTLDWALLASFRERLRLTRFYNELARLERQQGQAELRYREVRLAIVAPQDFFPVERIIDYDEYSRELIRQGYQAAERVFREKFGEKTESQGAVDSEQCAVSSGQ